MLQRYFLHGSPHQRLAYSRFIEILVRICVIAFNPWDFSLALGETLVRYKNEILRLKLKRKGKRRESDYSKKEL